MDQRQHRPPNPNISHHQSTTYRRNRDESRGGHFQPKRFRCENQHHQAGSSAGPPPTDPQTLGTRRQLYERDFPLYKQPVELGHFSLDSKRHFFNDARQLRYYVEPEKSPNFDLRDGYKDRFVKRDDGVKEKLDHILKWILLNRAKVQSKETAASSPW